MSDEVTLVNGQVSFSCGSCGNRMTVAEDFIGRRGKCQKCKEPLVVPGPLQNDEIRFECQICQEMTIVSKALAGETIQCVTCHQLVTVPGGDGRSRRKIADDADSIVDKFSAILGIVGWMLFIFLSSWLGG